MKRFLDAFSHLYMRVCPSVRPSVRGSVGPSVSIKEVRARTHLMAVYPALLKGSNFSLICTDSTMVFLN